MSPEALLAEHERLCFARAFPRSAAELRRTERALAGFERRVRPVRDDLENSGIAGTVYRYPFNYTMSRWLAARFGARVDVDWAAYKKHTWDEVAGLLSLVVAWAETEGLDDDDIGSWDWIQRARGHGGTGAPEGGAPGHGGTGARKSDLAWLLERLAMRGDPEPLARHLYEMLSLPLVWDLSDCRDAITHARLPVRRPFFAREILKARPADFAEEMRAPIGALERLDRAHATRVIDAARAALSQREREFHVIVHAHPGEVYRVDADRGLDIYVFGLARPQRLTLEADYGALLVRNGVPIGYGYAALVSDRADIAINIFPTYRAGESPFVFTRFAALFCRHFGARRLVMRRYQLGYQNPEGIEAGSFWFYWKLGFRSTDARVRRLAEREAARLARRRGARSDPAMLRRLARSDMVLGLDGAAVDAFRDVSVRDIGLAVTRMVERRFAGDRARAVAACEKTLGATLGARVAGCRLAPVAALIPGLAAWPAADRAALGRLIRLKEGARERPFVLALQRHDRFRRWLARTSHAPFDA